MRKSIVALLAAAAALTAGAAQAGAPTRSTAYQAYAIVEFKTDVPKRDLADAIEKAVNLYTSDIQSNMPLGVPITDKPGRIQFTNVLEQGPLSAFSGLAAMSGTNMAQFQMATCPGAHWQANISRQISSVQAMRSTLCLYLYGDKDGVRRVQLQVFVNDTQIKGGSITERITRKVATSVVGTAEDDEDAEGGRHGGRREIRSGRHPDRRRTGHPGPRLAPLIPATRLGRVNSWLGRHVGRPTHRAVDTQTRRRGAHRSVPG